MQYLVDWAFRLVGRSGSGLAGLAPLSHREIEAWARLSDIQIEPQEVDALIRLDLAIRDIVHERDDAPEEEAPERPEPAWPERRKEPVRIKEPD